MNKKVIVGIAVVVAATGYLIVASIRNTSEYYLTVKELKTQQVKLYNQDIRVAGRVKIGTSSWDPVTLTLKFDLIQPLGKDIYHVICIGQPKPDMFADNKDVIVEGKLSTISTIAATHVLTSCPSKYVPKVEK